MCVCGGGGGGGGGGEEESPTPMFKIKSETRMTASVVNQDGNT